MHCGPILKPQILEYLNKGTHLYSTAIAFLPTFKMNSICLVAIFCARMPDIHYIQFDIYIRTFFDDQFYLLFNNVHYKECCSDHFSQLLTLQGDSQRVV